METLRPVSKEGILLIVAIVSTYVCLQLLYGVFNLSYFWDELGVYSRSSEYLYENGLSLLPSSIPDELSRGHPLLCPFYFALAFKLFGAQPLVAHLAAALLNTVGFYYLYKIFCLKMKPALAAFATWSVFIQPLFLSQSLLQLPEMPLMVMCIIAIYYYLIDKPVWAMVFVILALQIKESALIVPIAFFITETLRNKTLFTRSNFYLVLMPLLSFAVFFSIQRVQRGYFFFPYHTELASFEWYFIKERLLDLMDFLLFQQGHFVFFLLFAALSIAYLVSRKREALKLLHSKHPFLLLMVLGGIGFTVLNFYISRYTLFFFICIYILFYFLLASLQQRVLKIVCISFVALIGLFYWNRNQVYTDVDFTYSQHVKSIEQTFEELSKPTYDKAYIGFNFPASAAFWEKNNGYKITGNYKITAEGDTTKRHDYIVFTKPGNMQDTARFKADYALYKRFQVGYAESHIYKRKQ